MVVGICTSLGIANCVTHFTLVVAVVFNLTETMCHSYESTFFAGFTGLTDNSDAVTLSNGGMGLKCFPLGFGRCL